MLFLERQASLTQGARTSSIEVWVHQEAGLVSNRGKRPVERKERSRRFPQMLFFLASPMNDANPGSSGSE